MHHRSIVAGIAACLLFQTLAHAQKADADPRAEVEAAVKAYVAAFNKHDAEALAKTWTTTGVYTSQTSGVQLTGREELLKAFTEYFETNAQAKLAVTTDSIDFVSPSVALENGTAVVSLPDQPEESSNYSAVYIKVGDAWLIDRLTEEGEQPATPSHHEHLKDLEWLIGDWVDQDENFVIETSCQWTKNQNHLFRVFKTTTPAGDGLSGIEIIGWNAADKKICSWVFDSNGGFAKSDWTKTETGWSKSTTATLADGKKGSSVTLLKKTDDGNLMWQRVNRVVDGEILPNIDPVIIVRKSAE